MFLRKIPYRSVRRQKIRHLLLLALRCLAIAIVVAAFARPFFDRQITATPAASNAREVVLVMDRSYSMANGGRWERALSAARTVASQIGPPDRLSVVAFGSYRGADRRAHERARADGKRCIATLRPTSEPTRYAAGFRMAAQILAASDLPKKEIVLVSDFHRFGWTPNDDVALPASASVRTVDVSRGESADVAVASVSVARTQTGDRVRAVVTARASNLGRTTARGGRHAGACGSPGGDAAADGTAARDGPGGLRGGARVRRRRPVESCASPRDSQPANDAFFFTVAEESGASALIVEPRVRAATRACSSGARSRSRTIRR